MQGGQRGDKRHKEWPPWNFGNFRMRGAQRSLRGLRKKQWGAVEKEWKTKDWSQVTYCGEGTRSTAAQGMRGGGQETSGSTGVTCCSQLFLLALPFTSTDIAGM